MCKKLIYLTSFALALGIVDSASADLVASWRFDEGGGNITTDEVGGVEGDVINATWVAGLYPNSESALEFNGSDAYVDVVGQDWGTFNQVSIAVWLKFNSLGAYSSIFHEDWTAGGIHFMVRGSGVVGFSINGGGPDNFSSQAVLEAGEVYHVVVTFDIASGYSQIYINGVLDSVLDRSPIISEIFLRSPFTIGSWNADRYWDGVLDDLRIYDHVVTEEEIAGIMAGVSKELASQPNPEDEMSDVVRDTVLSWTLGEFANTHNVYLGTVFDDVNDAVLADADSAGQTATTYDPPGRLDFGQTYFWRIDEVNAPPDSTVFKGDVWSFTTELFAYPVENITATASSSTPGQGPEKTVDGSGLVDDLHSAESADMWLTAMGDPGPAWIQYEFDKVLKLHEIWVWNQNTQLEPAIGFGIKDATVEYSVDGTNWTTLGTTHEFARGTAAADYEHNTTVDFEGAAAKYVKLTANTNWGGIMPQYGLSEVRFLSVPALAGEPDPATGATGVDVNVILSWRAGREAAEHNVYLSSDEQAVIDGTATVTTVTEASYTPSPLDLDTTYYWRVDEVNDAETPAIWQGDIWSFSIVEYLVVDDFEAYNDIPAGEEGSNLVYLTWIDGYVEPPQVRTNGSTMGHTVPFEPSMERVTVYDGKRSAPLYYDNTTVGFSEVTANLADLGVTGDWTKHGIQTLVLWVYGATDNAPQQMYVKVGNAKVPYGGDITEPAWMQWSIDLAGLGINLSNVTQLSIGLERIGATGGSGMVLVDAIRLY